MTDADRLRLAKSLFEGRDSEESDPRADSERALKVLNSKGAVLLIHRESGMDSTLHEPLPHSTVIQSVERQSEEKKMELLPIVSFVFDPYP